jgi:hypothetical protein
MSTLGYTGWKKATIALIVFLIVVTLSFIGFAFGVLMVLGLSCVGCLGKLLLRPKNPGSVVLKN